MNIVLIGCGTIGKNIVEHISKEKHNLTIVDSARANHPTLVAIEEQPYLCRPIPATRSYTSGKDDSSLPCPKARESVPCCSNRRCLSVGHPQSCRSCFAHRWEKTPHRKYLSDDIPLLRSVGYDGSRNDRPGMLQSMGLQKSWT